LVWRWRKLKVPGEVARGASPESPGIHLLTGQVVVSRAKCYDSIMPSDHSRTGTDGGGSPPGSPRAVNGAWKARLEEWGFEGDVFLDARFRRLVEILLEMGHVLVAYSGGVDSAFLLKVARSVLGDKAVGVLGISESLDRSELEGARSTAAEIGVPLMVVETHEYENPEYRRNDGLRCYHCKSELFLELKKLAAAQGIPFVLDGSNADDTGDYRPGLRARDEHDVRSPLLEAGLDKASVRRFSRALGLSIWDKPAAPCLSSRIPHGSAVTAEKLRQIEAAEGALRALGFRVVRVRHHEQVARIEVPREELSRVLDPAVREAAARAVKAAGFLFVAVDLEGFRSGSLNAALGQGMSGAGQEGWVRADSVGKIVKGE
jgi:uncharacterized protein